VKFDQASGSARGRTVRHPIDRYTGAEKKSEEDVSAEGACRIIMRA
jgi:hypothetical protein